MAQVVQVELLSQFKQLSRQTIKSQADFSEFNKYP